MLPGLVSMLLVAAPLRVAVLPFGNDTGDPAYDPMRRGLADMVMTDLVGAPAVTVVERERISAVLDELKLQHTRAFDPATAQKLGRLLGATHEVYGEIIAVAPEVRLDVKVIRLGTGEAVAKASVRGAPADLFSLEETLVARLLEALHTPAVPTSSGHPSLASLVAYSSALDALDAGALDLASSKLAESVRASPEFDLAKVRYADVLKRLREAKKKRGDTFDELERAAQLRLSGLLGSKDPEVRLGARVARCTLALVSLKRLTQAKDDVATWVPLSKRAAVEALEQAFLDEGEKLVDELAAVRGKRLEPRLPDDELALEKQAFGLDLAQWSFLTPTSVAVDLGRFIGSGWSPHFSDVEEFALRPSRAQRAPAHVERARKWFARAQQSLPLDAAPTERAHLAVGVFNEHAEMLVLLGRREEAVAQWQAFLDAWPTAEDFPVLSAKVEAVMSLSDEDEKAEARLRACDESLDFEAHARRIWRASGRAGLVKLGDALAACAPKRPALANRAWQVVATEAQRVADCPAVLDFAARAQRAGGAPVTIAPCDVP
jgi:TolB-like protein